MSYVVVFVTTKTSEEAKVIAQSVLEQRLAACVNIVPHIESMYWWENKITTATEALMIIKTTEHNVQQLMGHVKSMHSYTVPEIISLPISKGNPDYLQWIQDNCVL